MNKLICLALFIYNMSLFGGDSLLIEIKEFAAAPQISKTSVKALQDNLRRHLGGSSKTTVMSSSQDGTDLSPELNHLKKSLSAKDLELIYICTHPYVSKGEFYLYAADSTITNLKTFVSAELLSSVKERILLIQVPRDLTEKETKVFEQSYRDYPGLAVILKNDLWNAHQLLSLKRNEWAKQIFKNLANSRLTVSGSLVKVSVEQLEKLKKLSAQAKQLAKKDNATDLATSLYSSASIKERVALRHSSYPLLTQYIEWMGVLAAYQKSRANALMAKSHSNTDQSVMAELRKFDHPEWANYDNILAKVKSLYNQEAYKQSIDYSLKADAVLKQLRLDVLHNLAEIIEQTPESRASRTKLVQLLIKLNPSYKLKYGYQGLSYKDPHGIDFSYIASGTFNMGSPKNEFKREYDENQRSVTLTKGFYLARYELTEGQWQRIMGGELERGPSYPKTASWRHAQAFCQVLSKKTGLKYRLPTEAEWEYACRAGTQTAYSFGQSLIPQQAVFNSQSLSPAGSGKPNQWGIYDMHGSLWEWCSDWASLYDMRQLVDPKGPSDQKANEEEIETRVVRGGSFLDEAAKTRSANRWENSPSVRAKNIGFRLVLELNPKGK